MVLASIFRYELRTLLRSRARLLALAAFFVVGLYALLSGQRQVDRWEAILAEAERAQAEQQDQVRAWYAAGLRGPAEQPWIDVTSPSWADRLSGSHMGRAPAPLAALSLGLADARAESARVDTRTNPYDGKLIELANPEKLLAGHLDLAFVLAFLAPLLLLILVFDVGGYERDSGMLALVRVQRGRLWPWLVARLSFHAGLVALAALALILAGGALTGALLELPAALVDFGLLSVLYVAAWGALFTCVAALGCGSAFNALSMSVLWIVLCLLGPAAAQTRMQLAHPPGYAVELTSLLREETYGIYERDFSALVQAFYRRHPHLARAPYALQGERDPARNRFLVASANLDLIARRGAEQDWRELEGERSAARLRWLLPSFALLHGLNLLAGNEAAAYREFRAELLASVEARLALLVEHAWQERPLDAAAFERLAALSPPPRAYPAPVDASHLGPLLAWLLLPALLAALLLRSRGDARLPALDAAPREPLPQAQGRVHSGSPVSTQAAQSRSE